MVAARNVRIGVGFAPVRTPGARFTSLLTENFDDNSQDTATWAADQFLDGTVAGVTVSETGGQLQVTGPASTASVRYSGYVSVSRFVLNCSYVSTVHTACQASEVFYFGVGQDANNAYYALIDSGTLYFYKRVVGVGSVLTTVGTWSATTHKRLRLRWGGSGDNTVYLDTATSSSSDPPVSSDWTQRASAARDSAIDLTNAKQAIGGGAYASIVSPTTFIFDGFNTASGTISGIASITEADDALSSASAIAIAAAAAPTEGSDTLSSTAAVAIAAALAKAEGDDTLGSASTLAIAGALASTEASDTVAATGAVAIAAALASTEAGDTVSGAATLELKASLAATDADDTLGSATALAIKGALGVTEADDTLSAAGAVGDTGAASITEADDSLSATATLALRASAAPTEGDDTLSGLGALALLAAFAVTEAGDTLSANGLLSAGPISGTLALAEDDDELLALLDNAIHKFWRNPPLIGRRTSPGRSR